MKRILLVFIALLLLLPAAAAESAFTCSAEKQITQKEDTLVKIKVIMTVRGDKRATETTYIFEKGGALESTRAVREVVKDGYVFTEARNDPILALVGVNYSGTECDWVKTLAGEQVAPDQGNLTAEGYTCTVSSADNLFETRGNACTPEQFEQAVVPLIKEPDEAGDAALMELAKKESATTAPVAQAQVTTKPSAQKEEGLPLNIILFGVLAVIAAAAFFVWKSMSQPKGL